MIHIELGARSEASLNELAAEMQVSPEFIAQQAIESILEDHDDYLAGMRSLANTRDTISQEEMERRSELAD